MARILRVILIYDDHTKTAEGADAERYIQMIDSAASIMDGRSYNPFAKPPFVSWSTTHPERTKQLSLSWADIYAGPDGAKHFQTNIDWLLIDVWIFKNGPYLTCKELGFNQHRLVDGTEVEVKASAISLIDSRIEQIKELTWNEKSEGSE